MTGTTSVGRFALYGLSVDSCVSFPAPPAGSSGAADIEIRYGTVPESLDNPPVRGARFAAALDVLLVEVPGVARYLARDGRTITIARAEGATDDAVAVFLLGSVMAGILHQRGDIVLHGAAVSIESGAVAFLGRSGVGKSTIATALSQRGHGLFADDVCVVRRTSEAWCVQPGLPRATLWPDSLRAQNLDATPLARVRREIEKRVWPAAATAARELPLRTAYLLEPSNADRLHIDPVVGADAFHGLLRQTYRPLIQQAVAGGAEVVAQTLSLATQVRVARVIRPQYPFRLRELIDELEADMCR